MEIFVLSLYIAVVIINYGALLADWHTSFPDDWSDTPKAHVELRRTKGFAFIIALMPFAGIVASGFCASGLRFK